MRCGQGSSVDVDFILQGYCQDADTLTRKYETIDSETLFAPVACAVEGPFSCVLDVGAGSGRDAAWLAGRSDKVIAVEPVAALRNAAKHRHGANRITWLDDRLPDLDTTGALSLRFDLITVVAVWQHLDHTARRTALITLRGLMAANARLVISVRDGAGADTRPVYPADIHHTLECAQDAGLDLHGRVEARSLQQGNQAAQVRWTWLVFRARKVTCAP